MLRHRARVVLGRGGPALRAVRRPTPPVSVSSRPGSTMPSSAPATGAQARRALGLSGRRSAPALRRADPTAEGARRRGAGAGSASADDHADARLVVVGGPSGPHGEDEVVRLDGLVARRSASRERVVFVSPRPHELLSTYYRAADVCLVPSRSESFGLVALEAAACGTPVVASDVGGLRSLVDHGRTGFLVEDPDLRGVRRPGCARSWPSHCWRNGSGTGAVLRARRYTWARGCPPAPRDLRRAHRRAASSSARERRAGTGMLDADEPRGDLSADRRLGGSRAGPGGRPGGGGPAAGWATR